LLKGQTERKRKHSLLPQGGLGANQAAAQLAGQDGTLKSHVPLQEVSGIHLPFSLKLDPLEPKDALSGNHAYWSWGVGFQEYYCVGRIAFSSR